MVECSQAAQIFPDDLPAPHVAVRNLVEQARFSHLCTVMSHMHHRRARVVLSLCVAVSVGVAVCDECVLRQSVCAPPS